MQFGLGQIMGYGVLELRVRFFLGVKRNERNEGRAYANIPPGPTSAFGKS